MKKYAYVVKVYVTDRNRVADLLDTLNTYGSVEIDTHSLDDLPPLPTAQPKPKAVKADKPKAADRRKRKSKVNNAILERLYQGQATIGELKSALESAGMSAASLSTGIAALTKSGDITRIGDGVYDVTKHDAAA